MNDKFKPCSYRYLDTDITVEQRGDSVWAVCRGGYVLTTDGLSWESEPLPSSRSDDFISHTRFKSVEEAFKLAEKAFIAGEAFKASLKD